MAEKEYTQFEEIKQEPKEAKLWEFYFDSPKQRTTIGINEEDLHVVADILVELLNQKGVKTKVTVTDKTIVDLTKETSTEIKENTETKEKIN